MIYDLIPAEAKPRNVTKVITFYSVYITYPSSVHVLLLLVFLAMASLFSSKSSLSGSNTPASTRPPSYDSERLPRYSFDGALTTNPAQAAVRVITRAPLAVIDETPEVRKEKDPFAGYGGTIGLIGILLFLNGLVVASIWFITAIKLKPWNYAHIAEHKEK